MEYSIVRVDRENYTLFDDMVFFRINDREKTPEERAWPCDFDTNYATLADKNLRVYGIGRGSGSVLI